MTRKKVNNRAVCVTVNVLSKGKKCLTDYEQTLSKN